MDKSGKTLKIMENNGKTMGENGKIMGTNPGNIFYKWVASPMFDCRRVVHDLAHRCQKTMPPLQNGNSWGFN
jgi:hypothetical protein